MVDLSSIKADEVLDCKGLSCPMPMLKIKKALQKLGSGKILEVWGTDPGTKNEVPKMCEKEGYDFLGFIDEPGYTRYFIKKK
jgi:tRNA 2-thiouridine synthesizing protein A